MARRTIIIIGFTLGVIGTLGSLLMLITGTEGASVGSLIIWPAVLLGTLYYERRTAGRHSVKKG